MPVKSQHNLVCSSIHPVFFFFKTGSLSNLELDKQARPAGQPVARPTCLYLPSSRITSMYHHTHPDFIFLMWILKVELRSSHLRGNPLTFLLGAESAPHLMSTIDLKVLISPQYRRSISFTDSFLASAGRGASSHACTMHPRANMIWREHDDAPQTWPMGTGASHE